MRCSRNLKKLSPKELELLLKFYSGEINDVQLNFICTQEDIEKSIIVDSVKDLEDYLFSVRVLIFCFVAMALTLMGVILTSIFRII